MSTETLEQYEEYIHIICLSLMGLLMLISAYEVCASSINDQPRIKYRFTVMLFCFVQLIITLMATLYFVVKDEKYRDAIGEFMRLCGVTGRILGVLCCYSFLLTIVKSLYRTPTYRKKLPRWFKAFTKIFCLLLIVFDIIQTIISFIMNTTAAQNVFMFFLEIWIFLFCIASIIALQKAKKQLKVSLYRSKNMYSNSVMSPRKPSTDREHQKYNPSSSKFDVRNISLPKTVNLMDIDGKSMRSKVIDNEQYKKLRCQMIKIYVMILFNFIVLGLLIIGAWYLYKTKLYKLIKGEKFPPMTESPMSSIDTYLIYTSMSMLYIVSLLWWLYIPKSFCCDNIAIDSMFYFCCTYTLSCCFVLKPSELYIEQRDNNNNYKNGNDANNMLPDDEDSADFDFFNVDTWRSTFRITTYRSMSLISDKGETTQEEEEERNGTMDDQHSNDSDPDLSLTDDDYKGIKTQRQKSIQQTDLPPGVLDPIRSCSNGSDDDNGFKNNLVRRSIKSSASHHGLTHSQSIKLLSALDSKTKLKNNISNHDDDDSIELTNTLRDRGISAFSQVSTQL